MLSTEAKGFFTAAAEFFKGLTATPSEPPATPAAPAQTPPATEQLASGNDARFAAIAQGMEAMAKGIEAQSTAFTSGLAAVKADVAKLLTAIETTDANPQQQRPPASGGATQFATDC